MSALDNPPIVMIVDQMVWMVNFEVLLPPVPVLRQVPRLAEGR